MSGKFLTIGKFLHVLQFGVIMDPYKEYCLNEAQRLHYLKSNRTENEKFNTYLAVSTIYFNYSTISCCVL